MHIASNIKSFLYDEDYFVTYYKNNVYVYNYQKLNIFTNNVIELLMDNFSLIIKGSNLKIIKMESKEIMISGKIESIGLK